MAFTLTSSAFSEGKMIPSQYTCDDVDQSPPLTWQNAPANTKSFALILNDPDAPSGDWVHWVIFNIPATEQGLEEAMSNLPEGAVVGANSWGNSRYNGPCPPYNTHRYFFRLYALDTTLPLQTGAKKSDLDTAMQKHILGTAMLMGTYKRQTK